MPPTTIWLNISITKCSPTLGGMGELPLCSFPWSDVVRGGEKNLFGKYLFILSKIYTIFCKIVINFVYYSLPLFIFVTFILVRKY